MDYTPYKLQVKLPNGADFNAEGREEIVQQAFERFLTCSEKASSKLASPKQAGRLQESNGKESSVASTVDPAFVQQVFAIDPKHKYVSLRVLPPDGPNKANDAALMLLYGNHKLLHMMQVPVTRLKKGLKQSAIPVDRVDRIMETNRHLVNKSGSQGVGNKYSLNNQGMIQVEGLLGTLELI